MMEVGQMSGKGETSAAESTRESQSHFAAWAIVSSPLVLGFDLSNQTELENAWPVISNKLAMEVSQCWEAHRPNPSGAPVRIWQAETLPVVVAGCGDGCPCVNKNANCSMWAKENQCEENPGYMNAVCPASCPKTANTTGWKLTEAGLVETPSGDCLDAAGMLPPGPGGLNWLRTAACDPSSPTQKFSYADNELKSTDNRCLGVESHWQWAQPMVSLLGCGGRQTALTLDSNGTMSTGSYGCYGVSNIQGAPSSLWHKPLPDGKTAVRLHPFPDHHTPQHRRPQPPQPP